MGDRESGIMRIFKLFVYVGKVMDHLSVTFYFGFSDIEYLKREREREFLLFMLPERRPTYLYRNEGINCIILNLNETSKSRIFEGCMVSSCLCILVCCK